VRYTGYRDRPLEERQVRFQNGCREGHTELVSTPVFVERMFYKREKREDPWGEREKESALG